MISTPQRPRSRYRGFAGTASALALVLAAVSCGPKNDRYQAEIRWTSYGIPHIQAADLGSLGYGEGYAQARDHLCSLADQVIRARGERARFFGAGTDDEHLLSDLGIRALDLPERAAADQALAPPEMQDWLGGYVAGYNRYLEETGVDAVPGWCRGQAWVRPITTADLAAYHRLVTITGSNFATMIANARPPESPGATSATKEPTPPDRASNGWAIGRDRSANGRGMLVANPHYPWNGSNRFWEKHLTIPGDLDVYGVGLIGIPGVAIGFNEAVAWTHTVSAGKRFTLYSLDLVPGDPTAYRYDGEERRMTARTIAVDVRQEDGTLAKVERTLYASHYGPMLDFPGLGWTAERAITFRDANQDNDEGRVQWLAMDRARSMDEFRAAHALGGMPWVNTIAASSDGRAWYADGSATPNLSAEAIEAWRDATANDETTKALWARGTVLLDGSDSRFEWLADPASRDPGVVPFEDLPSLERSDYVFNANDSYWLANPRQLVTGYSPLHGEEQTPRSLRTRMNATTLDDTSASGPAGEDGKFDLDELGRAILENRSFAALALLPELVERCRATPKVRVEGSTVDLAAACEVLATWDGRYDIASRGAVLFREWITGYQPDDLHDRGNLFAVGFDPADPVGTPRGLAPGPLALENLARAVSLLAGAGIAIDTPLGELQHAERGGRRIPLHGGDGTWEGVENWVRRGQNASTLEPEDLPEPIEGSRLLTPNGYPVTSGTSFLMALAYTDSGPQAKAFLTYSQSGDPTSKHFWDQTELFSKKEWRPILFRAAEVEADVKERLALEGPRG